MEVTKDNLISVIRNQARINSIESERLKKVMDRDGKLSTQDRDVMWMMAGQSSFMETLVEDFNLIPEDDPLPKDVKITGSFMDYLNEDKVWMRRSEEMKRELREESDV